LITTSSRILIHSPNPDELSALAQKLRDEGFRAIDAMTPRDVLAAVAEEAPNIVIIDADRTPRMGLALIKELKRREGLQHMPVFLIAGDRSARLERDAMEAGADAYLAKPYGDAQLFSRLGLLTRLATMQEEISRRAQTAAKYGVSSAAAMPEPAAHPTDVAVLVLEQEGAAYSDVAAAFSDDYRIEQVQNVASAFEMLGRRDFDAVLVDVRTGDPRLLNFCIDLRKNSRFYNIPVMIVADESAPTDPDAVLESGATDILIRPFGEDQLRARMEFLVRQQRYRVSMQGVYREARHIMTSDGLTGLYTHGFLLEHLRAQIADAERGPKNLTIGMFDVKGMAAINSKYGYAAGDRLLRQIGGMIGGLARGEDLPARYGGEEFCVAMPDTPTDSAITAIHRIAGVINQTEFAVYQINEAVRVHLKTGYATLVGKETAEGLVQRARNMIL
jgi:two-component system cell cycle response regulator